MDIAEVQDKARWNDCIQRHAGNDGGFLQSWEWGEFQKSYGRKVMRMATSENNEIVFGWQIIEMPLPLGLKYWYVARPMTSVIARNEAQRNDEAIPRLQGIAASSLASLGTPRNDNIVDDFFKQIHDFTKKENTVFIRIDGGSDLEKFGCKKVDISIQPQEEFIIDITKSEEQLLAEMKPKTRYNIRVAEKHGVKIESVISNRESGIFFDLIQKTSERQGIHPHPKEYYQKMLEVLGSDGAAALYTAQYQGKIIAANLITYFGKTATYLHGGTDDEFKNVMAPYLLQWHSICDAKKNGYELYNFGGVSNIKKSWEGITRFKTGFSLDTKFTQYGGVWDLPVNNIKYGVYRLAKRFM